MAGPAAGAREATDPAAPTGALCTWLAQTRLEDVPPDVLHMKVELLRGLHGDRVATLATATPIGNSITEAHVMQR